MISDFILRIILFGISLYYMIEYLVMNSVSTNIGIITTIFTAIIVSISYYYTRGKHLVKCSECGNLY